MSDIGTAYVQIEPTAKGISGKIEKEMGGAGSSSGASFNKGFGSVLGGTTKLMAGAVAAGGAALAAAGAVVAGASIALYKVMKKRLKFSVEVLPEDIEDENELTAAVDVVDIDIPDEEEENDFEISFVEENDEE